MTVGRWALLGLSLIAAVAAGRGAGELTWELTPQPLSVRLAWAGEPVVTLATAGGSAFYLRHGGRQVSLTELVDRRRAGEAERLTYRTADGRRAHLTISPAPEGGLRFLFRTTSQGWDKLGVGLSVSPREGFYGLIEKVVQGLPGATAGSAAGLNLRGQSVWLYVLPTEAVYSPFFVSSAGYGVLVESDWPGTYRFGVDRWGRPAPTQVTVEYEGPQLSLVVYPGPGPVDAVARHARHVGTTVLPPCFAFGPWRWRDEVWDLPTFYDGTPCRAPYNSMIVEDALMMAALGIPCSVYVIDRPWAGGPHGYADLTWDPERLPAVPEMISWLADRGVRTLLWVGPWLAGELGHAARAADFHVAGAIPFLPDVALVDFTRPPAREWWQALLAPRVGEGIAGFKLDRGDEKVPDGVLFGGRYADGTPYRAGHNPYPAWFASAAVGAFAEGRPSPPLLITRAAWMGSQRVAVVWGGDSAPTHRGLRAAIIAQERCAAMNFPIWGSDTGGYGGRPSREVLSRWLGFSCFSPIMEVGPTANLAPWSWAPDGAQAGVGPDGYRFTPHYDHQLVAVWILYARLHADLADYLYQQARLAHQEGIPIVRPLPLAFPDRPEYVDRFQEYLLGPDLLVRPVWEPGADRVEVWLPPGQWVDAWNGARLVGPSRVEVAVPLHKIPVFLRQGASLSLGHLPARWEEAQRQAGHIPDLAALQEEIWPSGP
ncbi:MAG: glycoside hydrolase family 31 protein [Candidatus Bipolaricaulaceae bacterium]